MPASQPPPPPFPCPRCGRPLDLPDPDGERTTTITTGGYMDICMTCTACEDQRRHAGWPAIPPDEWPVDPDELGREYALLIRTWRDVSNP